MSKGKTVQKSEASVPSIRKTFIKKSMLDQKLKATSLLWLLEEIWLQIQTKHKIWHTVML